VDGATNWKSVSNGLPRGPAVSVILDPHSPVDQRRLWVSLFGVGIFRSEDGGDHWTATASRPGYPGNPDVYRLQLLPDGALLCAVTARRTGNVYNVPGGLWRSRDGGERWECLTDSLRPFGMVDYTVDPRDPRTMYLCTAQVSDRRGGEEPGDRRPGLFRTTDDGKTWTQLPVPLAGGAGDGGEIECFAPILHPADPHVLFVTTTGRGCWVSRDSGDHWQEFRAIPFLAIHRLTFDPANPHLAYLTTFGGGAWKVTLK
jgi:photosystem II stability/assembly factor-like uncharacterized protein